MKPIEGPGKFYSKRCDITSETDVIESFKWIEENLAGVHILVNNAGVSKASTFEGICILTHRDNFS